MHFTLKAIAAVSIGLVLASCAPKPQPIMPEPVYDKYGAVITTNECRPSDMPISPNYPERLPVCEQECPPGTQRGVNTVAAAGIPQCVPIPNEGSDTTQQRGKN
jgi:hypothetical protein